MMVGLLRHPGIECPSPVEVQGVAHQRFYPAGNHWIRTNAGQLRFLATVEAASAS
jgi:hypothetical protein